MLKVMATSSSQTIVLDVLVLLLERDAFEMADFFFGKYRFLFVLTERDFASLLERILTTTRTSKVIRWLVAQPEFDYRCTDFELSDDDNTLIRATMDAEALENVEWLIENGVDPSAALTSAVIGKEGNRMKRLEKVSWLFSRYGDRINANVDDGMPLHASAMANDFETVNYLLDHGADPNIDRNDADEGNTLCALMSEGQEFMTRHLISRGAKFQASDVMELYTSNSMYIVNALRLFVASGGDRSQLTSTELQTKFAKHLA